MKSHDFKAFLQLLGAKCIVHKCVKTPKAHKKARNPRKECVKVMDTSEKKGCISMANIREKRPHSMALYGRKQRNILLHDVCCHIQSRTDLMEGLRFFGWRRSWLTSSPAACWYSAQRTGRACRRSLRPAPSPNAINMSISAWGLPERETPAHLVN